jgi:acetoacetyl-CoA reductase
MTRVAVVTGGTRGIGAAIAKAFKAADHKVAVTYSGNEEAAEKFRQETGILALRWDASDYAQCQEGIRKVEAELGPVDILVNNAGITRDTTFHKMSEQQWDDVIRINLKSCFSMTRAVIEGMRERNFGRIIQISSVNGQRGQYGQANYGAAKAGMIGFTKSLAFEGANKGITVNCVAPGYVDTDMVAAVPEEILKKIIATIPVGRLGYADDIARAVLFLASDGNGFITGATLSVNGGQYMVA